MITAFSYLMKIKKNLESSPTLLQWNNPGFACRTLTILISEYTIAYPYLSRKPFQNIFVLSSSTVLFYQKIL